MRYSLLLRCLLIGTSLCVLGPGPAQSEDNPGSLRAAFRVAGYLPDYRLKQFDADTARRLTDLILFSAEPTAAGGLTLGRLQTAPWTELREFKARHRVRLILCVGGWRRSAGFPATVSSPETRLRFVQAAIHLCIAERLDGLDLDWEHPKDANEQAGYALLLAELREAFRPHGLTVSLTMAAWQQLPSAAFEAVDWVHLMAYDADGRHATPEMAERAVRSLLDRGVPREKIVLGLPFYGRHVTNRQRTISYAEIVEKHRPGPEVDEIEGFYFNGPETVSRKTRFALESRLGGVMIWEIGQDARGDAALLRTIADAVSNSGEPRGVNPGK